MRAKSCKSPLPAPSSMASSGAGRNVDAFTTPHKRKSAAKTAIPTRNFRSCSANATPRTTSDNQAAKKVSKSMCFLRTSDTLFNIDLPSVDNFCLLDGPILSSGESDVFNVKRAASGFD
jgi:hypothetical protein